jgi:hypothetical protein
VANQLSISGFANLDCTDKEQHPSGVVSVFPKDALVDAESLPHIKFLVVCPVVQRRNGQEYTDADFSNSKPLNDAIVQFSAAPPALHNRSPSTNADMNEWHSEIGEDGFAGIFKKMRDNGRSADYYIVAHAGASVADAELKDYVSKLKAPITYGTLLDSPQYAYVKNVAQRNAQRLAYQVARGYKVPVAHTQDTPSYTPDLHDAPPMRAESSINGGHLQATSSLRMLPRSVDSIADAVGSFHGVCPLADVSRVCYVIASPYDGIAIFKMNNSGIGDGLPATTGRTGATIPANFQLEEKRQRGFTWEQQAHLKNHPDLHPSAFRRVDESFLRAMRSLGWKQEGVVDREYLVPVAVKISNPELKRTL